MSKFKLIKSIRFCERWGSINPVYKEGVTVMGANIPTLEYYFNSRGSTRKLSVWESGSGGKNRVVTIDEIAQDLDDILEGDNFSSKVAKYLSPIEYKKKDFSKLAWLESDYGNDAFIFQYLATQAAILRREKVWFGTSYQTTEWTNSGLSDKTLSEWWGEDIKSDGINSQFKPVNETDLKWRKTYSNGPPYFEIIQDPYVEPVEQLAKNKLKLRSFGGSDPYFLNNGAKIIINWSNNGFFEGGDVYSDNWQNEMNGEDIGKTRLDDISKRVEIRGPEDSDGKSELYKFAQEITVIDSGIDNTRDLGIITSVEFAEYSSKLSQAEKPTSYLRDKSFNGMYDVDLIKLVIDKWHLVYSNEKLALTEKWDYSGDIKPTLEFIPPAVPVTGPSGGTVSVGDTGSTGAQDLTGATGATGASASRVHGSYIFDVTKNGYLVNIDLGELIILEKESIEDPFILNNFEQTDDYGNVVGLGDEYIENEFTGAGETMFEQMESPPSEEKKQEDAKVVEKLQNSEPINVGNHKLDLIPGEFVTNGGTKIQCCQINGYPVNVKIAGAYLDMVAAAKKDGVTVSVGSGFRSPYDSINTKSASGVKVSASSQKFLYDGWIAKKPNFNLAAAPGNSNHGNGISLDTNAGGKSSGRFIGVNKEIYIWLVKNSWKYGFLRSVKKEEWHFDYLPDLAKKGPYGQIAGTDGNKFYSDWGLDKLA